MTTESSVVLLNSTLFLCLLKDFCVVRTLLSFCFTSVSYLTRITYDESLLLAAPRL